MRRRALLPMVILIGFIAIAMIMEFAGSSRGDASTGLRGRSLHDFGEVDIAAGPVTLSHTFSLTNQTNRTISVRELTPSCGCLDVEVDSDEITPGARMRVTVMIRVYSPGVHRERIAMILGDESVHMLELHAVGRRGISIHALPNRIRLSGRESTEFALLASNDRSDQPPQMLDVDAPEEIVVELGSWTVIDPGRLEAALPKRWSMPVTVRASESERTERVQIVLHFPDHESLVLPLIFD